LAKPIFGKSRLIQQRPNRSRNYKADLKPLVLIATTTLNYATSTASAVGCYAHNTPKDDYTAITISFG